MPLDYPGDELAENIPAKNNLVSNRGEPAKSGNARPGGPNNKVPSIKAALMTLPAAQDKKSTAGE